MKLLLLLPPLAALSLWATPQEDPAQAPGPKIGKAAPVIRLNDETGAIREVGPNEDGLWTVLAFYPKAATPGWIKEVCSLRDAGQSFSDLGAQVYGVSLDSVQDQARFAEAQELNFSLLSDPDGSAGSKYGVLKPGARYTQRSTFILDDKGVLKAHLPRVSPTTHGEELRAMLEQLMDG